MLKVKDFLKMFLVWRTLIFLAVFPVMLVLPIRPGFTFLSETDFGRNLFQMWTNFDGVHYITLAIYGHGAVGKTSLMSAFFPVYPWLICTFNEAVHHYTYAALLVSNLSFFLSLILLYKIYLLDYKEKIARSAITLLLIFPTAFFFGSAYTESVFLLLSVLAFFFARKKNFLFAGIFAAIASATRITGIFLWPAIIIEFYLAYGPKIKKLLRPEAVWLSLPPLGLISYMRYQFLHTGSAVTFITTQSQIGSNRVVNKLILLHQVFYRYIRMVIFVDHTDPLFFTVLLEFLVGLGFLAILIFSFKKIRPSYWIYCLLSYILPTFTGTFSSLPRYVVVLFPLFGFLAVFMEKRHPYFRYLYYAVSVIFAFIAVSLFTRGYFVA
jgi:Gpi18-like mannosyltransferase